MTVIYNMSSQQWIWPIAGGLGSHFPLHVGGSPLGHIAHVVKGSFGSLLGVLVCACVCESMCVCACARVRRA